MQDNPESNIAQRVLDKHPQGHDHHGTKAARSTQHVTAPVSLLGCGVLAVGCTIVVQIPAKLSLETCRWGSIERACVRACNLQVPYLLR